MAERNVSSVQPPINQQASKTFFQDGDDFLALEDFIAALEEERSIGDAIDHIFCRAKLGDLHGKPEFLHPIFHGLEAFLGNLLICLAFRINLPDFDGEALEFRQAVRQDVAVVRQ